MVRKNENCRQYRECSPGVNWQHLVPAGNQRVARQFYVRAISLGGARRNFGFRGHRWIAVGEPETEKRSFRPPLGKQAAETNRSRPWPSGLKSACRKHSRFVVPKGTAHRACSATHSASGTRLFVGQASAVTYSLLIQFGGPGREENNSRVMMRHHEAGIYRHDSDARQYWALLELRRDFIPARENSSAPVLES